MPTFAHAPVETLDYTTMIVRDITLHIGSTDIRIDVYGPDSEEVTEVFNQILERVEETKKCANAQCVDNK